MSPKPWEVTDDDLAQGNMPAASTKEDESGDTDDYMLVDGDDEFEELDDPWQADPPAATPARPIGPQGGSTNTTAPAARLTPAPSSSASTTAAPATADKAEPAESAAPQGPAVEAAPEAEQPHHQEQEPVDLSATDGGDPAPEDESMPERHRPAPPSQDAAPTTAEEHAPAADPADNFDDFDDFWDEPVPPDSGTPAVTGYDLGPSPAGAATPAQPIVPGVAEGQVVGGAGDDDEDPDDSITVTLRRNREVQQAAPSRGYRTSAESRRPVRPSERRHKMDTKPVKRGPLARMKQALAGETDQSRAHETSAKRDTIRPLNVVVLGKKGGVGKTVVTTLLGHTFASVRKDRVLAVDASPTGGNLSARCPRDGLGTVVSLVDQLEYVTAYANVREHTAKGDTGLEVLGADVSRPQRPITGNDYRRLMDELRRHYQLILSDTPGDITAASADGDTGIVPALLDEADLLVLVAEGIDGANSAIWLVNWLKGRLRETDDRHLEKLLDDLIVVVTSRTRKTNANPERMSKFFSEEISRRVVVLPFDQIVEGGLEIDYNLIAPKTRKAMLELADAVTGSDAFTGR